MPPLYQSTAVLSAFLLAMTRYPEVMKKAQEEIDQVTSCERLPDFDDRPSLPYLDCILKEVFRSVWPVTVAHIVTHSTTHPGSHVLFHLVRPFKVSGDVRD